MNNVEKDIKTISKFLKCAWPVFNIMIERINLENLEESRNLILKR